MEFQLLNQTEADHFLYIVSWGNEFVPKQIDSPLEEGFSPSLLLYELYQDGHWVKLGQDFHPHGLKSGEYRRLPVDKFIGQGGKLKLKIGWTERHNIDKLSIVRSEEKPFRMEELELQAALHSNQKDVADKLRAKDHDYAHIVRGDKIDLAFAAGGLQPAENEVADYFVISQGYYHGLRTYLFPEVDTSDSYIEEVNNYIRELNDYRNSRDKGKVPNAF